MLPVSRSCARLCRLISLVKPRAREPQRSGSFGLRGRMRTTSTLALLLVSLGLGCSKHPAREPVTLTFLDVEWEASDNLPGLGQDLQAFTRETGIQVKRLPAPDSSLKQLALWQQLLQKGDPTPDVYGIDVIWAGILNQYFIDLRPAFDTDLADDDPEVVAAYTVDGKLVAMPRHAYIGVLVYRPDLLRRYGFREPPKTWDGLEKMAARIQKGERAQGKRDFWGYVWPGGIDEDLTCVGLEWQISEGGGHIIEDDKTISVNNPQTVMTWQRAKRWMGTISPPGVVAYAKWDADNLWDRGKVAFSHSWVSDYSLIASHPLPDGATRYGVSSLPGGRAGRYDTLGGNGLAVSRTSKHLSEAMELIRFLRKRDVQFTRTTENAEPPKELEFLALPSVLHLYPQLPKLRENGGSVVARPSITAGPKYEAVTRAYIETLRSVLLGERTAPMAAASLEKQLVEITGFQPGPPKARLHAP
jgi:trehalose/maltose transport system substrate-binding protein